MPTEVIVAIIALAGTLAGSFTGVLASGKLTAYRLKMLEDEVRTHNNFARRMPVLEEKIGHIEEDVKELKEEIK